MAGEERARKSGKEERERESGWAQCVCHAPLEVERKRREGTEEEEEGDDEWAEKDETRRRLDAQPSIGAPPARPLALAAESEKTCGRGLKTTPSGRPP